MTRLDRRKFILGALAVPSGAALLAACGGDADSVSTGQGSAADPTSSGLPEPSTDLSFLVPTFPDGFRSPAAIVAGVEQRITFVVRDEIDIMRQTAPSELAFTVSLGDVAFADETVRLRSDGVITPYYPIRFTAPQPGEYVATLVDHPGVTPIPFVVMDPADGTIPQVGDTLPVVDTPTIDDARGVTPICTRAIQCPFHEHNLTDMIGNGRPTVLIISTPGFCQTDICGPVVDLLIDGAEGHDDIDFIHAEVYGDPSEFDTGAFPDTTAAVKAMGLPYEPALFVTDANGILAARLDTMWDRSELADALAVL